MSRSFAEMRRATRLKRRLVRMFERGEIAGDRLSLALLENDLVAS